MDQLHLVARDVDELLAFGLERATLMNRSLENLFSETSHLPSASLVSPMEVWLCPGW